MCGAYSAGAALAPGSWAKTEGFCYHHAHAGDRAGNRADHTSPLVGSVETRGRVLRALEEGRDALTVLFQLGACFFAVLVDLGDDELRVAVHPFFTFRRTPIAAAPNTPTAPITAGQ